MAHNIETRDAEPIHVAGTFGYETTRKYDRSKMQDYIKSMLDREDILYNSVITLEIDDEKMTVQCRLHKAAISKTAIDDIADIFEAMDGHIETWVSTESVMQHPEIYRG